MKVIVKKIKSALYTGIFSTTKIEVRWFKLYDGNLSVMLLYVHRNHTWVIRDREGIRYLLIARPCALTHRD